MKKITMFLLVAGFALTLGIACLSTSSSSDSDGTTTSTDSGGTTTGTTISINGAVNATRSNLSVRRLIQKSVSVDACPTEEADGTPINSPTLTPSTYEISIERLSLLKSDGTAVDVIYSSDDPTLYVSDLSDDLVFADATEFSETGTYSGIEIVLFYLDQGLSMVISSESETESVRNTRMIFHDYLDADGDAILDEDGTAYPYERRDFLVAMDVDGEDVWHWANPDADTFYPITETRPDMNFLDLFADEAFWDRDDVTISSTDTTHTHTMGFSFDIDADGDGSADASPTFTIEEGSAYTVTLTFTFNNKFTYWENVDGTDGVFELGLDCGLHPFLPNIMMTIEETEATTDEETEVTTEEETETTTEETETITETTDEA